MNQAQESKDYLSKLPPELINLILLYVGDAKPLTVNQRLRAMLNRTETAPFWRYRLRHDFPTFCIPVAPANYQQLYRGLVRKEKAKKDLTSQPELLFTHVHLRLWKLIYANDLEEIKALVQQENKVTASLLYLFNTMDHRSITAIRLAGLLDRKDILAYIFGLFVDAYCKEPGGIDPWHTRLYWAACCGMIAEFAHFSLPNIHSLAILKAAVKHGYNDIVDILLKAKVKPNNERHSPLVEAAAVGNLCATRQLLTAGANWQELSYGQYHEASENFNPLWIAAKNGHTDIVKELLVKGAKPIIDMDGNTIIYIAAKHGHAEVVKLFIKSDIGVDQVGKNKQTPLYIAAFNGHADVVSVLLEAKANVDFACDGETALCAASRLGHVDVVAVLIAHGASLDKRTSCDAVRTDLSALYLAVWHNNLRVVNTLLQAKADVNAQNNVGETPLHAAAGKGHLSIVKALLLAGATDSIMALGSTALNHAIVGGHIATAILMLRLGVPAHISGSNVASLHLASTMDNAELIKMLLEKGANPNLITHHNTPLHAAITYDNTMAIDLLLAAGASVNLTTDCEPALHYAIKTNKNISLIRQLLEAGADIHLKDNKGNDALSLAKLPKVDVATFALLTLWQVKEATKHLSLYEKFKVIVTASIDRTSPTRWHSFFFDTSETKLLKLLAQYKLPANPHDLLTILKNFTETHRSLLGDVKYDFIKKYLLIQNEFPLVEIAEPAKVKLS